jgi:hypothetical protein
MRAFLLHIYMKLEFAAKVWLYKGVNAAWHFITLPVDIGQKIKYLGMNKKAGWGAIRVKVCIRKTSWETSVFPSKELSSYILPIKSEIRKNENIMENDIIDIKIEVV